MDPQGSLAQQPCTTALHNVTGSRLIDQPGRTPSRRGGAQVTAEEAMYNLWLPTTFQTFLRNLRDSQITAASREQTDIDPLFDGFIAPNVPVLQGTCGSLLPGGGSTGACLLPTSDGHSANSLDLSWTAAYPLNVG